VNAYIDQVFKNRKANASTRKILQKKYEAHLNKAFDVGYTPSIDLDDTELVQLLRKDIKRFSKFKEASFEKVLIEQLIKNNRLVSFNEFKKAALATSNKYNLNWLATEFNHTVASANAAAKYQEYVKDADLYPNLEYHTVGDERVRDSHKKWDGFIAPVNDKIWETLLPPNDYGCRCNVTQTDDPVTKDQPAASEVKPGFKNNPALSKQIWEEIPYKKHLDKDEVKAVEQKLNPTTVTLERYKDVPFKKLAVEGHGDLEVFSRPYKQNKQEYKPNLETLKILAENGEEYRLLPVLEDGLKNPDGYNIKEKRFVDIKVTRTDNGRNAVQSALKEASKQLVNHVIINFAIKPKSYTEVYKAVLLNSRLNNRNRNIRYITIIFHDKSVKTYDLEALKKSRL